MARSVRGEERGGERRGKGGGEGRREEESAGIFEDPY